MIYLPDLPAIGTVAAPDAGAMPLKEENPPCSSRIAAKDNTPASEALGPQQRMPSGAVCDLFLAFFPVIGSKYREVFIFFLIRKMALNLPGRCAEEHNQQHAPDFLNGTVSLCGFPLFREVNTDYIFAL